MVFVEKTDPYIEFILPRWQQSLCLFIEKLKVVIFPIFGVMNRKQIFSAFITGCLLLSFDLRAQPGIDPDAMVKKENERIFAEIDGLTDKQKEKVTKINEDFVAAVKDLMANRSGDRQEMRGQMRALREEKEKAMQNVFTGEQFEKYKTLMAEIREERRGRREGRRRSGGRR